jgi:hypothetical protein
MTLTWGSPVREILLHAELPFWLLVADCSLGVTVMDCTLELSITGRAIEIQRGNAYQDSHSNTATIEKAEGKPSDRAAAILRDKSGFTVRTTRTLISIKTNVLGDALAAIQESGRRHVDAQIYFRSFVHAHLPFVNKTINAYRRAGADPFAVEVTEWDIPVWYIDADEKFIPISLIPYKESDNLPSRTRSGTFARTFRYGRESVFELSLARMLVLFEDIRIEFIAAAMLPGTLPLVEDACGPEYRMCYFIRRGIGTLREYCETVARLSGTDEFQAFEAQLDSSNDRDYREEWLPAAEFFGRQRTLLEKIRNDVGGHFGETATRRAFKAIPDDYVSRAAIEFGMDDKIRVLHPFTKELTTAALLHHLPGNTKPEEADALMELLKDAFNHALNATHFLLNFVLWDRMG